jgi:cleavage and polyadenylation specificity factor subunit 3
MEVKKVIFCAHADFDQTVDYIHKLCPKNVILVHGEKNEAATLMMRLKNLFADNPEFKGFRVESPENNQEIVFEFEPRNDVKVMLIIQTNNIALWKSCKIDLGENIAGWFRY